jgi:hypothetical protein
MKYRKKPVEIEAMQVPVNATPPEAMAVYQWVESHIGSVPPPGYEATQEDRTGVTIDPADGLMTIRTLDGDMKVSLGDWVIRGVQGEFYPCKPDIFEATYEPVERSKGGIFLDVQCPPRTSTNETFAAGRASVIRDLRRRGTL